MSNNNNVILKLYSQATDWPSGQTWCKISNLVCLLTGYIALLPGSYIFIHKYIVLQPSYRLAIRTEGMIEDLVKNLKSQDPELQMHCAAAIFKVQIRIKFFILTFLSENREILAVLCYLESVS